MDANQESKSSFKKTTKEKKKGINGTAKQKQKLPIITAK